MFLIFPILFTLFDKCYFLKHNDKENGAQHAIKSTVKDERPDCKEFKHLMKSGIPRLYLFAENRDVVLECDPCWLNVTDFRNSEHEFEGITWSRKHFSKNNPANQQFSPLKIDGDKYLLKPGAKLLIEDLTKNDAGEYACYINDKMISYHHVDVVAKERRVTVGHF